MPSRRVASVARLGHLIREQALDADGHVFEASGGIEARRHGEPQVGRGQVRTPALRHFQQRR